MNNDELNINQYDADPDHEILVDDDAELDEARRKRRRLARRFIALFCLFSFLGLVLTNYNVFFSEWPPFLNPIKSLSSQEFVQRSRPAVVRIEAYNSGSLSSTSPRLGTGFNIDARGLIITNRHIVENSQEIRVSFADGRSYSSKLTRAVQDWDLALVKLNASNLPVLEPDFGNYPAAGEVLTIIGNPEGYQGIPVQGELTGYVTTDGSRSPLMLINANIGRGNSGSPVLDTRGRVVGVVFAMTRADENSRALAIPLAGLGNELGWNE